jgi:DNA-binding SARP family transcriptional activator
MLGWREGQMTKIRFCVTRPSSALSNFGAQMAVRLPFQTGARAVLAMLCVQPNEPMEREYLSKILWPGRFEAHAKASLRQCLLDLGRLLGPSGADILVATRTSVALRPANSATSIG